MSTQTKEYAVTIVGGGMVGLLFAALLADAKIKTAVIESHKPTMRWAKTDIDSRVSAVNVVSQRILKNVNVWSAIDLNSYSPLTALKVWDAIGGAEIDFDSADTGAPALGAIVENREIVRALWQHLEHNEYVDFYCPHKGKNIVNDEAFVEITLDDEQKIRSQLIVGADGASSWVRQQMSGDMHERSYDQNAVVAVVETEEPHQQTGWQAFLPDGILALLPLANVHHCAIVWSTETERANHLVAMSAQDFNREINNEFGLRLGQIKLLNEPKAIPLVMRHVKKYVEPRIALIGDAAHTIHPLAGQGVNLGFMDAACLAQCIIEANENHRDIGSLRPLRRYERWRKGDNVMMIVTMRGFKELFGSSSSLIIQARNMGLNFADRSDLIKNCFMRIAMGESVDLPVSAIQDC
ncbi:UbiH/UbiF/VisC/COQ6 family ubiquinone biosynthesis hydroxylase [Candidiatus Paracoxiella cheracis]|uniref:UbiH/UbiF/VisC/COQ6 family ubiquinone biosynthesis hydroxylase n=1 Tax=Candidiatus Paracoxiella cheracis TaxID=3405120 RepID=UPI003BF4D8E2